MLGVFAVICISWPVLEFGKSQKSCNDFFKINFYWSIVALQCCVHLYCIAEQIRYKYTYILSFLTPFPFRSPQSPEQGSLSYTVGSHQLSVSYVVSIVYICQLQSPNSFHPFLPPLVSIISFYTSVLELQSFCFFIWQGSKCG